MEWIVLDDGADRVEDIFAEAQTASTQGLINFRYLYDDDKKNIGAKRNRLNRESKGEIIVAMDDDDFYFPERVHAVVQAFKKSPKYELAGSSEIYMYYSDIKEIYKLGPYHPNHATNGTMAWRRSYASTHLYDEEVTHAEERSFLDNYKHPMIQLNPMKVMLVMSHTENTFDKKKMRDEPNPFVKRMNMRIKDFIRDGELRAFFASA
jgi:glycosyltransferase involved in cell wall biosynthesis